MHGGDLVIARTTAVEETGLLNDFAVAGTIAVGGIGRLLGGYSLGLPFLEVGAAVVTRCNFCPKGNRRGESALLS